MPEHTPWWIVREIYTWWQRQRATGLTNTQIGDIVDNWQPSS